MKQISAKNLFFLKKVFPVLWFGFLVFFVVIGLFSQGHPFDVMFLIVPLFMGFMGFFIMKKLVWDLMDEAYDAGDHLIVKKGNQQEQIAFSEIKNINYNLMMNPPRVTVSVRRQTIFGDEISFSPPSSIIPFKKNPLIKDLIDRVDEARRQQM